MSDQTPEVLPVPWPSRNLLTARERQAAARAAREALRKFREHCDEDGRCEHMRRRRVVEFPE
jgi:hypothetical protein